MEFLSSAKRGFGSFSSLVIDVSSAALCSLGIWNWNPWRGGGRWDLCMLMEAANIDVEAVSWEIYICAVEWDGYLLVCIIRMREAWNWLFEWTAICFVQFRSALGMYVWRFSMRSEGLQRCAFSKLLGLASELVGSWGIYASRDSLVKQYIFFLLNLVTSFALATSTFSIHDHAIDLSLHSRAMTSMVPFSYSLIQN